MLKIVIFYLALLNVADGWITKYGLDHNHITEANPMMAQLYNLSPTLFVLLKVGLSILLLILILVFQIPRTNLLRGLTYSASLLYTFIFVAHSYWLFQL